MSHSSCRGSRRSGERRMASPLSSGCQTDTAGRGLWSPDTPATRWRSISTRRGLERQAEIQ